jgi:DNA replication protein DnaC
MQDLTQKALSKMTTTTNTVSKTVTCWDCGNKFEWRGMEGMPPNYIPQIQFLKCDTCIQALSDKLAEKSLRRVETRLDTIPTAFRQTVKSRLPFPQKLDEALQWKFGARGLMFLGPTRGGKSRILWELAKREIKAGKSVRSVTPYELLKYPALFMAGNDAAGKFAETLATVDLLLLDDVFKAKLTERVEELIFAIIDERSAWERPCLVTVNETGATLAERMSSDRGPALISRLREFCQTITFEAVEARSPMSDA